MAIVAAGIGAAGVIGGAVISGNASQSAANTQQNAANTATALQGQIYNNNVTLEQPYNQAGLQSLSTLQQYLGQGNNTIGSAYGSFLQPFNDTTFQNDPGYQFQLQQGQQALERQNAAGGTLLSGKATKDSQNFAQGLASTGYDDAFNRYNTEQGNIYNRLMGLTNLGQSAASFTAQQGSNYANQAGQNIIGAGNAAAAGQVGTANAISNGLNGVGNSALTAYLLNNSQQNYGSGYTNSNNQTSPYNNAYEGTGYDPGVD
jgi:hypothetical protein